MGRKDIERTQGLNLLTLNPPEPRSVCHLDLILPESSMPKVHNYNLIWLLMFYNVLYYKVFRCIFSRLEPPDHRYHSAVSQNCMVSAVNYKNHTLFYQFSSKLCHPVS